MTKKNGRSAENDPGLAALLDSNTSDVCVVGKSWDFHVDIALNISNDENLKIFKRQLNFLLSIKKTLCLMRSIFLMDSRTTKIMLLIV